MTKTYTIKEIEDMAVNFIKEIDKSKYMGQPTKDIMKNSIRNFIVFINSQDIYYFNEVLNDRDWNIIRDKKKKN